MGEKPKITQAMIQAYDEYTHITLDRRGFMDKLTRLAGSAAAAAAIMPMIASNYAHAEVIPSDDKRITVQDITFPGPAGALKGYLATPAAVTGKLPAVVVIHENRGLNPHIRDVTRRLAVEGYLALAPDLLTRLGGTPPDEDAAAQLFSKVDRNGLIPDADAASAYLRTNVASNGRVGAVGFCFGGGIVNQMAVTDPQLVAGVAYYGMQPKAEETATIKAKLMEHYAGLDDRTNAGIPAFDAALKKAGVDHQMFVYEGANHAFNNDTSAARYDKKAADLAWSRTLAFFKQNLS